MLRALTAVAAAEPAAAQVEVAVPEPLPEPYTSLFKQAKEAPTEFNTWTSLISAAEKLVRMSSFVGIAAPVSLLVVLFPDSLLV